MSYVKKINGYIIKDEEARQDIQNIKSSLTGAMHYIGRNVPVSGQTPISDGVIAGPWNIAGQTYNTQRFGVVLGGGSTSKYIRNKELDEVTGGTEYYAYSLTDNSYDSPSTLYVRDATITTSTTLYENRNSSTFEPVVYDHSIHSDDIHNLISGEKQPDFGSVATYQASSTSRELEFVFGPDGWSEFGSTGSLKALAFKDNATGTVIAVGSNAASAVTLSGGSTSKLVTTSITPVNGTESVSSVSKTSSKLDTTSIKGVAGTESVSKVTKNSSKLVTTTITGVGGTATVHDTPTLNKTSITPVGGSGTVHDTPTLIRSSIGSASDWNAGSLPSVTYDEATETLTFGTGSLPTLTITSTQVGTGLTAGTKKTFATAGEAVQVGTSLTAGTEKTFATADATSTTVATGSASSEGSGTDIVTSVSITDKTVATAASSNTTVATGSVSDNGSGADIITEVEITSKTVAKAGTAVTVATGSVDANGSGSTVVTSSPTGGTAAAQTFTGSSVSVTVS